MKIKVCGINRVEDALDAVSLGVDAVGFVFSVSPWQIDPQVAKDICTQLPPFVTRVGIFSDEDIDLVNTILKTVGLDVAQLDGAESPVYCREVQRRVVKSFHLENDEDVLKIAEYKDVVSSVLIDVYSEGSAFNWGLATAAKEYGLPLMLRANLDGEEIKKAVKIVKPDLLDINSCVEKSPGIKDYNKLQKVIKVIRGVNQ